MRILVLGGTRYLGRHFVEAALARGHRLTLFNRGRTAPDLFPDVEQVRGDREAGLAALDGRRWDAVMDPSGSLPSVVRASALRLIDAIDHYVFISSISVYAETTRPGLAEGDTVARLAPGAAEELTGESYGALKALCEEAVEAALPGRALSIRAGLICGPYDPTDRSAYWPRRMARGGEVLAPGRPGQTIQFVDVRDLSGWIVRVIETRAVGVFNATGPREPLTMERYLAACREVAGVDSRLTWMDERFLLERGVAPFSELPLWVPEAGHAFENVDCSRAIAAGLTFRPVVETVRDTLEWDRGLPPGPRPSTLRLPIPVSLSPERESELLRAWHEIGAAPEASPPAR